MRKYLLKNEKVLSVTGFRRILLGILSLVVFLQYSHSQSVTVFGKIPGNEEDIVAIYNTGASDSTMTMVFLESTPMHYNTADLPRFSIIGKQKQYYLGIGGYVKATVNFDFDGTIGSPVYFTPANIDIPATPGNSSQLNYSVATTNLFLHFVGMPNTSNRFSAYVNANFTGTGNTTPSLQFAYIQYRGFTFGYSTSLFTDLAAGPPTIDQEGPNGWTFVRTYILSYTKNWENFGLGISAEMPDVDATYNNFTSEVYQRIPDIPAYVQVMWGDYGSRVRLSGLMRNMMYREYEMNGTDANNKDRIGYGLQLSGNIGFGNIVTLFYQGTYGNGISSYFQDVNGQNWDMFPNQTKVNELVTPEAWGGLVGLQFNITQKLFASLTYSQVRVETKDGFYNPDYFKYSQYFVANVFCKVRPNLTFGLEYLWGKRKNMDDNSGIANRIQTVARFNF